MNLYEQVFCELNKHKVKYLIVGGVAVNLHGYNRFTGDIDIVLTLDEKNLERMEIVMKSLGYVPRLPVELFELRNAKKVKEWMETKGLKAYTFISSAKPQLDIDILVGDSLNFPKIYKGHKNIEAWGLVLPVVSLDYLITMKKEANRPKDLEDLAQLLLLKDL